MALADFQVERTEIKGKNYTFSVRGLSFTDLAKLVKVHLDDLGNVFELYEQQAGTGDPYTNIALGKFVLALVKDAPGLVAHAIALAADEEAEVDKVAKLPFIAQVDAIKEIGRLTFEEVGGVKKLIESLAELLENVKPQEVVPSRKVHKKKS